MNNLLLMQLLKPEDHLIKDRPDVVFLCESGSLLCVIDLSLQIAVVAILHDNTQTVRVFFEKGFFVGGYVGMVERCQDSDLVEGVFLLFRRKFHHFDLNRDANKLKITSSQNNLPF